MKKKNYFGDQINRSNEPSEDNLQFYKELGENLSKAEVRPETLIEQK